MKFQAVVATLIVVCATILGAGLLVWQMQSSYQSELTKAQQQIKKLETIKKSFGSGINPQTEEELRAYVQRLEAERLSQHSEMIDFKNSEEYMLFEAQKALAAQDRIKFHETLAMLRVRNPSSPYLKLFEADRGVSSVPVVAVPSASALENLKSAIYQKEPADILAELETAIRTTSEPLQLRELKLMKSTMERFHQFQVETQRPTRGSPIQVDSVSGIWGRTESGIPGKYFLVPRIELTLKNQMKTSVDKLLVRAIFYDVVTGNRLANELVHTLGVGEKLLPGSSRRAAIKSAWSIKVSSNAKPTDVALLLKENRIVAEVYISFDHEREFKLVGVPIRSLDSF